MNRREFSALLPMLFACPVLETTAEAQAAGSQPAGTAPQLPNLKSGQYVEGPATSPTASPRTSHRFTLGMLPNNIRLEAHVTVLTPAAPAEPIGHHAHSELWFVRQGTVKLMTAGVTRTLKAGDMGLCVAGDDHCISNASNSEPASYFVVAIGPPE